jgi:FkbM family methyltransferase
MKHALIALVKRTPLYSAYSLFIRRRMLEQMRRTFWDWSQDDQKRLAFYKQFIAIGDIVFDVGANMGNRAKVFSRLGAVIIAVEPQPTCADFLVSVFQRNSNFHLVRAALGAAVGEAEMLITTAHAVSSLSPDWIRAVKESGRFSEYEWDRTATVPIDTLDNLIARFGRPAFVKIDVEGFEDKVISGLSVPVGALSLEFTPEFIKSTHKCIDHLCEIADPRFQVSLGESMEFILPEWVTAEEIKKRLSEVPPTSFGDLYARFI